MKRPYEKPVIVKMQTGMMNKYGSSPQYARRVQTEIDGVAIDDLIAKYGSPLFVFSETALRRKYREFHTAFATRYPNVTFGWSYKTNYLNAVCAVLHDEGAIAEVVSEMEYEKARLNGMPGNKIIFNGPHKSPRALERAVQEEAIINIDHAVEIANLEAVADKLGKKPKVGLRVNLDAGIQPVWSRFGFNLESGQVREALRRIAAAGKLTVNGLHCHIGTYILEPEAYAVEVRKLLELAAQMKAEFGFTLEYLDIGGGFPSKSRLKGTYQAPELVVPGIDEYAEKITQALYKHLPAGEFPRLILESGRGIVDEAGSLITTVHASKRLADGRRAYLADAGVNLLYTAFWYKYNIAIDRPVQGINEPAVIYGPLCMNIDMIEESTMLPALENGTRLTLWPVGAYSVTQWMQFIEYRPNVVMIGRQGEVDVIREAEDITDLNRRERVPERLLAAKPALKVLR